MTSTLVSLSRSFLLKFTALAIGSAAVSKAEIVNLDLDALPIPTGSFSPHGTPYDEQGLRLSSSTSGITLVGPLSSSFTGTKAYFPTLLGSSTITMQLFSPAGRRFTVKSATIHPFYAGASASIPFAGAWGGNVFTQSHATGTALAGTTVTFNSNFQRIGNLSWQMTYSGGLYNRFQISSIVVEFDGEMTTPAAITVAEAAGTAAVPVSLDSPRSTDTTVTWEVTAITATQPADFTFPGGSSAGTVTIPAGQTAAVVNVPIINDTANESPETFRVSFTAPSAGVLFPAAAGVMNAVVTIASDDGVTTFPNWMTAHGLTSTVAAADADPNGDGISNIECWLFRLNPAGPNPSAWMARRAVMNGGSADPGLRFVVPTPLPSDVRIIFSQSADLGSWTEQTRRTGFGLGSLWTGSGAARVIESSGSSGRTITLRASVPTGQRPKLFLRNTYEYVSGGGAS
jgi:Calx-beta domain